MNLKETLYKNLYKMTLEEYQKYVDEADLGYIKINSHPEDENIVILNYTEMATFEKRWNNETMTARGLILDLTDAKNNGIIYILAKPFEKFPNYGLNEIEGYEDDIDYNDIDYVMEKMDGSLGISYFFKDELRFATRGSFTSDQAIKATEIWRKKYAQHEIMMHYVSAPVTYLVEIIYPENRVVVDYKDREELVLLGVIYLFGYPKFLDSGYRNLEWEANELHMPLAPKYELTIEKMIELKDSLSANEEGFIIRFKNGKRLKIKGTEYLNVHRVLHGLSDKAKFKAWSENKLEEYIMMLPEEFRDELEDFGLILNSVKESMKTYLSIMFSFVKADYPERKDFAIFVNQAFAKEYRKFFFDAYKNGEISDLLIREHIYKNYNEYLEVISEWKKQNSLCSLELQEQENQL